MLVSLVVDVPGHHDCGKSPLLCDAISIHSTERRAWDRCKVLAKHSTGYSLVELDREYAPGAKVTTIYPNCPCNCHPAPKSAETLETARAG